MKKYYIIATVLLRWRWLWNQPSKSVSMYEWNVCLPPFFPQKYLMKIKKKSRFTKHRNICVYHL